MTTVITDATAEEPGRTGHGGGTVAVIARVAAALRDRADLSAVCEAVTTGLVEELGVARCSVMLDRDGELRIESGFERLPQEGVQENPPLAIGSGIAGDVAARRESVMVEDVLQDARWIEGVSSRVVRSLLCVPMVSNGRLVGVLNVSDPEPGAIASNLRRDVETLGPVIGQLIAFAHLQQQLIAEKEGLENTLRTHDAVMRETQAGFARREKLAALGETLAGIAHELNNRLLPITMHAESLCDFRLPARQTKQVHAILDGANGVRAILEALLGFARQRKPRKETVHFNELVTSTLAVSKFALQRDGILIKCELDPTLPAQMADPLQIEQVLLNLLRNAHHAVTARGSGGGGLILVNTRREGDFILIRVRDNGVGIPARNLGRIMEPFFTTKPPGEGTGLGLAVCFGIMSEHGGHIVVQSQPGDTIVTLRFPIVELAARPASERPQQAADGALSSELRVLVIDDEESILDILHDVLDGRVQVETANSGVEAIQKLLGKSYDVVVSDMRMPGLGGREIFQWLKENRPGSEHAMILSTGDTFDPATQEFLEQSGVRVLAKPYSVRALLRAISEVARMNQVLVSC